MSMTVNEIFHALGAIVGVAMAFVLVSHTGTADIISASGSAFSNSLRASMGH